MSTEIYINTINYGEVPNSYIIKILGNELKYNEMEDFLRNINEKSNLEVIYETYSHGIFGYANIYANKKFVLNTMFNTSYIREWQHYLNKLNIVDFIENQEIKNEMTDKCRICWNEGNMKCESCYYSLCNECEKDYLNGSRGFWNEFKLCNHCAESMEPTDWAEMITNVNMTI